MFCSIQNNTSVVNKRTMVCKKQKKMMNIQPIHEKCTWKENPGSCCDR